VDGALSASFVVDVSSPHVVVTQELAGLLGVDPALLVERTTVFGKPAKLARGHLVALKQLVREVDLAVCDECVPDGVQGVLGAPMLQGYALSRDDRTSELVLTADSMVGAQGADRVTLVEVGRYQVPGYINDLSADRAGERLGLALSNEKGERTREVYQREKRKEAPPSSERDAGLIVAAHTGEVVARFAGHQGVVSTAALSPDGRSLVTGGWDKRLFLFTAGTAQPVSELRFGWSVRNARFSPSGRLLAVGAWTPQKLPGQKSDPAAAVYEVGYRTAEVVSPSQ
jgi:hypothetical protein